MPQCARAFVPGGWFFFTVALLERRRTGLVDHVDARRVTFAQVRAARPLMIDAVVVLQDHLHCIWTLPPDDGNFSTR